jgi:hypothetical protein
MLVSCNLGGQEADTIGRVPSVDGISQEDTVVTNIKVVRLPKDMVSMDNESIYYPDYYIKVVAKMGDTTVIDTSIYKQDIIKDYDRFVLGHDEEDGSLVYACIPDSDACYYFQVRIKDDLSALELDPVIPEGY